MSEYEDENLDLDLYDYDDEFEGDAEEM